MSNPANFNVKDSGARQNYAGGFVRDTTEGKRDYELVFNGPMLDRWAEHLTKGGVKYPDPEPGVANWTRATDVEALVRFKKSAVRHFVQWLKGDQDEDHAAALFFNVNGHEYVKAQQSKVPNKKPKPSGCYDADSAILGYLHSHPFTGLNL